MSERRCPRCGSVYAEGARFCAKDGSMLVDVQSRATGGKRSAGASPALPAPPAPRALERASTLTGQILDARYQVLRKLGEGGMSFVYLAREARTGAEVAIKVLSPKLSSDKRSVERLRREASMAMRLNHPNVCRILRLGEADEGLIYLVMPFLQGQLLSERELQGGPMELGAGLSVMRQVCAGLHHAHELQIVHRDLKPENIMLVAEGANGERAVVMDFGLAKERRANAALQKLTATGIILGTPEFMSPEQIRGKPLDGRSDVYALGIVAFEMFSGKLPFEGRNPQEMMIARLRGQPMLLRQARPDVPAWLEKALARAMDPNPDQRYATALEFAAALEAPSSAGGVLGKIKDRLR